MSWRAVARTDARTARRARGTIALFAVFLLAYLGLAAVLLYVDDPAFVTYLDLLATLFVLLVPLIAVLFGYESVIGERDSGTAALALSLPHSRFDLAVGKLAARTGLLAAAVGLGTLLAGVLTSVTFDGFDPIALIGLAAVAIGYGGVFLLLATGLSMGLSTTRRVITAAFGAYLGLVVFGAQVVNAVVVLLFRLQPGALADPPTWAQFVTFILPDTAVEYLLVQLLGEGPLLAVPAQSGWFVSPIVAVVALLAWGAVPFVVGYRRFDESDL
ncbi:hypothetical protein BRD16_05055 [Halobacteriales archaeon SW_6_65_46]|nr:MAG: hypothetical protein BRD16_05055 [Halobacteriales archaeon SW_6_65_46]